MDVSFADVARWLGLSVVVVFVVYKVARLAGGWWVDREDRVLRTDIRPRFVVRHAGPRDVKILVDGRELHGVTRFEISQSAGDAMPVVVLTFMPVGVAIESADVIIRHLTEDDPSNA